MTHQPRPNPDTTPAAVSLARVAAALTAWDTGRSPAVTGGVAGGADDGNSPAPAGRDATAPARAGEIQPGGAPT